MLSIDYTGGVDLEMLAIKKLSPKKKGEKDIGFDSPSMKGRPFSGKTNFYSEKEKSVIRVNEVLANQENMKESEGSLTAGSASRGLRR